MSKPVGISSKPVMMPPMPRIVSPGAEDAGAWSFGEQEPPVSRRSLSCLIDSVSVHRPPGPGGYLKNGAAAAICATSNIRPVTSTAESQGFRLVMMGYPFNDAVGGRDNGAM